MAGVPNWWEPKALEVITTVGLDRSWALVWNRALELKLPTVVCACPDLVGGQRWNISGKGVTREGGLCRPAVSQPTHGQAKSTGVRTQALRRLKLWGGLQSPESRPLELTSKPEERLAVDPPVTHFKDVAVLKKLLSRVHGGSSV